MLRHVKGHNLSRSYRRNTFLVFPFALAFALAFLLGLFLAGFSDYLASVEVLGMESLPVFNRHSVIFLVFLDALDLQSLNRRHWLTDCLTV